MSIKMKRDGHSLTYSADIVGTALPIAMEDFVALSVETAAAATLTVYGSNREDATTATFVAAYDADGSPVAVTAGAAGIYECDAAILAFRYIKLVAASATTVYLHFKS